MRAWPVHPGVTASGHVTSRGHWHPGGINGCRKCEVGLPCSDKTSYANRVAAERAAANARSRTGGELISAYRCEHHDAWHIGHDRRRRP